MAYLPITSLWKERDIYINQYFDLQKPQKILVLYGAAGNNAGSDRRVIARLLPNYGYSNCQEIALCGKSRSIFTKCLLKLQTADMNISARL